MGTDGIEVFFALHKVHSQCFEHKAALLEGELTQCRATHFAGILHHSAKIEAIAAGCIYSSTGDRIVQGFACFSTGNPFAFGVVFKLSQRHIKSKVKSENLKAAHWLLKRKCKLKIWVGIYTNRYLYRYVH